MPDIQIRPMVPNDWDAVERIYSEGIATGEATFEREASTWEYFDTHKLAEHRFVAVLNDEIVGWVAASPFSHRVAYAGAVELSIYVASAAHGQGVGRLLLEHLISSCESAGIWTINSTIFPGNTGSLKLHEKLGFRIIGRRERISRIARGPRTGQWQDVIILERRSNTVGVDSVERENG